MRNVCLEKESSDMYILVTGGYKGQAVVVKKAKRQTNQRETDLFMKEIPILRACFHFRVFHTHVKL